MKKLYYFLKMWLNTNGFGSLTGRKGLRRQGGEKFWFGLSRSSYGPKGLWTVRAFLFMPIER